MAREIDVLIAEHVMGLEVRDGLVDMSEELNSKGCWREPKPYSTDITAAWEVVEKLDMTVGSTCDDWFASVLMDPHNGQLMIVYSDTAPMAIAKASLKARGIEID